MNQPHLARLSPGVGFVPPAMIGTGERLGTARRTRALKVDLVERRVKGRVCWTCSPVVAA